MAQVLSKCRLFSQDPFHLTYVPVDERWHEHGYTTVPEDRQGTTSSPAAVGEVKLHKGKGIACLEPQEILVTIVVPE